MRFGFSAIFCLLWMGSFSQTMLFSEGFDLPSGADSVHAGSIGSPTPTLGDTTSLLAVSPAQSYLIKGSTAQTQVYLETDYFSTIGNPYVNLEFDHIAKLFLVNYAKLEVSIDSALSWIPITNTQYRGNDVYFKALDRFNQASYGNLGSGGLWNIVNNLATPDSSWWMHERFDLTGLASDTNIAGSFIGYPAVKIRFIAEFNSAIQPGNQFGAGWFIDNIRITGATCELYPPEIDLDFTTNPCYLNNPLGTIPANSSNSYPIGALATDSISPNSGVDSLNCYYQVNSGLWQVNKMPKQIFPPYEYKTDLANILPGDTVRYYISAWDHCGNNRKSPGGTELHQFIVSNYPSKCNTTNCDTLDVIRNFPWTEDFEGPQWIAGTGLGNSGSQHRGGMPINPVGPWNVTPALNKQEGWSVRTGLTGTLATGPMGDHTTGGGKYLYTEFSPSTQGVATTTLITPCIDLSDSIGKVFSFYYHGYGEDIKNLRIDIDTGSGSVAYWNAYQRVKGPLQKSSADPWTKVWVSLEPFSGKTIKIRLTSIVIGYIDKTDIAIDDLAITEPESPDLSLISIISPASDPCGPSSSVPVKIAVQNLGPDSLHLIPVAYQLDNGTITRDTLAGPPLAMADSIHFVFSDSLSFFPGSAHTLKIWSELSSDSLRSNDTLQLNIPSRLGNISQFPYYLDFENSLVIPGNQGNINDPAWVMNEQTIGGRFEIFEGRLDNTTHGPLEALGINNRAIRLYSFPGATNTTVNLKTTCVDLSGLNSPSLSFNHFIAQGKALKIRVKTDNQAWVTLTTILGTAGFKDDMSLETIALTSYAGQSIQIEFLVDDINSGDYTNQLILDNILIAETNQVNLGLYGEISQLRRIPDGLNTLPSFQIKINKTSWQPAPGTQLNIEFSSLCNPSATTLSASLSFTPAMSSNSHNQIIPAITLNDTLHADRYLLKAWLSTPGDSLHYNDTLYQECLVQKRESVPYFNDFESCNDQFNTNGPMRQWQKATSGGGAFSGTKAYVTNADTGLISGPSNIEVLLPPFFVGLDTLAGTSLSFYHRYSFNGPVDDNYGTLQYYDQGVWKPLATPTNHGINMLYSNIHGYVYAGSSQGQWVYAQFPLYEAVQAGVNIFRFVTKSTDSSVSNWEIDDFSINVPPQHSASPRDLVFDNGLPVSNNQVSIKVQNTGAIGLRKAGVSIYDQGGNLLLQDTVETSIPSLSILPGESMVLPITGSLSLQPGMNNLSIITSYPNLRNDAYVFDDTLQLSVRVLSEIDSLPYCVDFESSQEFLNYSGGVEDKFWHYGTPSKSILNGAYSGSKAWITQASGTYKPLANSYLYTPPLFIEGQSCYKFSFWHWYETEYNFDGGNVEFSLDGGTSWQVLGSAQDTTWYNTPYVQALDAIHPGFSGSSGSWIYSYKDFKVFSDAYVQFRFRFGSTATMQDEGWMIDDLCLERISLWCNQVGSQELKSQTGSIKLFPNPASKALHLKFERISNPSAPLSIQIINSIGAVVYDERSEPKSDGWYVLEISDLPEGGYLLRTVVGGEAYQKTFIKR